jgi:HEAT repeat protein
MASGSGRGLMFDEYLDDDLTLESLEALVEDNHPVLYDILCDTLDHSDRDLRVYAALKLVELFQAPFAASGLAEGVYTRNWHTRKAAAEGLWDLGDADGWALIEILQRAYGQQREGIINALELIGWVPDEPEVEAAYRIAARDWRACIDLGEVAVPVLIDSLKRRDGTVRRGAAWTLGQIGDPRAVASLIRLLDDSGGGMFGPGDRICDVAADALAQIGTPEALDALEMWDSSSV